MATYLLTADAVRDATRPRGDALLVEDGVITAVGGTESLRRPGLAERHFSGVVVPGLRDAHLHPVGHAAALHGLSLHGAADFHDIASAIGSALGRRPRGKALLAIRLDDEALAEGRLPDRRFLDRVAPTHPVLLVRHCGHIAVASTAALEAAGIDPDTPDPEGGSFDRDDLGRPTGVLRETAVAPVAAALRPLLPPLTPRALAAAVTALAGVGLTGLGAIVSLDEGLWGGSTAEIDLLVEAAPHLPIPLRVLVIAPDPASLEAAAARLGRAGPMVSFLGLKAFADGSLGGHTAALRRPYADRPELTGTHRLDPAWALEMTRTAASLGGRAALHAIGDAALSRVLDVFERAIAAGVDPGSLRVEHASLTPPEDLRRLVRLGVTACIQPSFLPSDSPWLEARLGRERVAATYAFRSLQEAGVPLAGGSDCPVEPPHPLWGMASARDRAGFFPEQALSGAEALALFTTGAATAIGEDAALEPGRPATFTILGGDPVTASAGALRRLPVVAVLRDGVEIPPSGDPAWVD
jgi:predicted amidohydrolase YtcJ